MTGAITRLTQFYRGIFYGSDPCNFNSSESDNSSKYIFKEIDIDTFKRDPIFAARERASKFCKRFDQGHRCYGFFSSNGSVASYLWISYHEKKSTIPWVFNMKLVLEPRSAYIWDCFTAPDHRRQGLYKRGLIRSGEMCVQKGSKKVYIFCAEKHTYSSKGIASAGFKEVFNFSVFRLGPVCLIRKASGRADIAIKGKTYDIISA